MKLLHRGLRLSLVAFVLAVLTAAPAQAQTEGATVTRPTVKIVKRLLTKAWDTDQENSVDKITLNFRSLQLMATRRAIPTDFVESRWVTPVKSVFDQRTVTTSPNILTGTIDVSCAIYRVNFTGIVWKGDFGWMYKNRNVTAKRISSTC
jgi:hypothetical protein